MNRVRHPCPPYVAHSDFLFDCYMRYTNTLMYVCMYVYGDTKRDFAVFASEIQLLSKDVCCSFFT